MLNRLQENKKELLLLAVLLLISGVVHGYNMFHYPAYFDDEGTYSSYAWAFLNTGQLSHYTYWYDHPPLGWLQIALWVFISGGFSTFGFALNSVRMFMLLLSIGSTFFIYTISRNFGVGKFASAIGTLIFILSPLAIAMNRMIFLDNIMIFWVLFSIWLLSFKSKRILHVILSSVALGIAILSKETALVFVPVFLWFIYVKMEKHQRLFTTAIYLFVVISFGISWILYATFKGELIPPGWFFTNPSSPHVSLVGTILEQLSRGGHGSLLSPESDIRTLISQWLTGRISLLEGAPDVILLTLGVVAIGFNTLYGIFIKQKKYLFVSLLGLFFILFLIRGGIVLVFYIIGLLPIFALNIAFFLQIILDFLARIKLRVILYLIQLTIIATIFLLYLHYNYSGLKIVLFSNQTSANINAVEWIRKNVPRNKFILTDDYAYIDLKNNNLYPNLIFYWKAQFDPAVNQDILKNDWRNIDYLLITPSFRSDISGIPIVKNAYDNSTKVASFDGDNYYKVEIYRVNNLPLKETLSQSWEFYISHFLDNEGKVTDHQTSKTTSEGQSYALLRAVWLNDKTIFDKVLNWTKKNMLLDDKSLFAWWYGEKADKTSGIIDKGTATDADEDIAFALLLANKEWGDEQYLDLAKQIIGDIWKHETAIVKGKRYITAGNWASSKESKIYTINPSYLAPYAYRLFAEVDKEHDWKSLVDTSYEILQGCTESTLDLSYSANIPPDWCALDKNGKIVQADISDKSTHFSYDAIRTLWRIALDYQWYKDLRALDFLQKMDLWSKEWQEKQKIYVNYSHDGTPLQDTESLAHYGTQLAFFSITNPDVANQIYTQKILSQWNNDGYWGDKNNYYDQNWIWFGAALYTDNLPNLWIYKNRTE